MTELSISIIRRAEATVVAAVGDIDLATASRFTEAISGVLQHTAGGPVIVDLAGVGFCDSSGVRALVHGRRLAEERSISFQATGATGIVLDVLVLTGVWAGLSGEAHP
ncbi:MAG TPA: STAS domain-containing protein [Micromonosporaceae bacterium]